MRKLFLLLVMFASLSVFAQAAHETDITITPPAVQTGVTITKFNVYKALTSGAYTLGTPYASALVGATPTTPVLYIDTNVVAGQKAFYVFTSVCPTCTTTESAFSGEISGTTPNPPNAPTVTGTWK